MELQVLIIHSTAVPSGKGVITTCLKPRYEIFIEFYRVIDDRRPITVFHKNSPVRIVLERFIGGS